MGVVTSVVGESTRPEKDEEVGTPGETRHWHPGRDREDPVGW